jgi:hypothetical protein
MLMLPNRTAKYMLYDEMFDPNQSSGEPLRVCIFDRRREYDK